MWWSLQRSRREQSFITLTPRRGRNTYFVFEDGEWKHRFGQEEKDLFMPDLSYEEFLEANQ